MYEQSPGHNKKQRRFQPAFERDNKSRKQNHHAQGVATLNHAGNINAIEQKHHRGLGWMRPELCIVTQNIGKPSSLVRNALRKAVDFERRFVKLIQVNLVHQRQKGVNREELRQKNKKRLVLPERLQKFFNKFI